MNKKFSIATLLVAAFVSGILFTTAGANLLGQGERVSAQSDAAVRSDPFDPGTTPEPVPLLEFENIFVSVAERINPMVVQIHSEKVVQRQTLNPFQGSPFEQFFRRPDSNGSSSSDSKQLSQALGSGVIILENGYIVTNNHVVAGADDLIVTLSNGEEYNAEVVGTDPNSDLAVIRIDQSGLAAITIPPKTTVRVGQWVLAFGSPLSEDLGNTVTSGIVSAIGRTSQQLTGLNAFSAFIQTDAAINPGNSGGPLVDLRGLLVGINSAIYSRSGGSQGIGFAIPVEVVKNVVSQLIENGRVERGFLGVSFDSVPRSLANALGVASGSAQVTEVTDNSPAAKAGLQEGDVIVSINTQKLRNYNELRTIVGNLLPGDTIRLDYVRDGIPKTLYVTLGKRSVFLPTSVQVEGTSEQSESSTVENLGFSIQSLSDGLRQQLRRTDPDLQGVIIQQIDIQSIAYRDADLRRGDIIMEIDRRPVRNEEEFQRVFDSIDRGKSFMVEVTRLQPQRRKFFTALTKPN